MRDGQERHKDKEDDDDEDAAKRGDGVAGTACSSVGLILLLQALEEAVVAPPTGPFGDELANKLRRLVVV